MCLGCEVLLVRLFPLVFLLRGGGRFFPEDGLVDWEREEMEPWEPDLRERCDSDVGV